MRNYTTQMDAARKGIVTPEIEVIAKKENMPTEALIKLVAEGKVAIPANKKSPVQTYQIDFLSASEDFL